MHVVLGMYRDGVDRSLLVEYLDGVVLLYFFFSSRRRHTRCLSDWSSDVCSSDLNRFAANAVENAAVGGDDAMNFAAAEPQRSEERRVGKECRSGWWRGH